MGTILLFRSAKSDRCSAALAQHPTTPKHTAANKCELRITADHTHARLARSERESLTSRAGERDRTDTAHAPAIAERLARPRTNSEDPRNVRAAPAQIHLRPSYSRVHSVTPCAAGDRHRRQLRRGRRTAWVHSVTPCARS